MVVFFFKNGKPHASWWLIYFICWFFEGSFQSSVELTNIYDYYWHVWRTNLFEGGFNMYSIQMSWFGWLLIWCRVADVSSKRDGCLEELHVGFQSFEGYPVSNIWEPLPNSKLRPNHGTLWYVELSKRVLRFSWSYIFMFLVLCGYLKRLVGCDFKSAKSQCWVPKAWRLNGFDLCKLRFAI